MLGSARKSSLSDRVLPGWIPSRLPDGSWGSRHDAPSILPPELVGRRIVVCTKQGRMFTTRILKVVSRSGERVLVRDTGFAAKG